MNLSPQNLVDALEGKLPEESISELLVDLQKLSPASVLSVVDQANISITGDGNISGNNNVINISKTSVTEELLRILKGAETFEHRRALHQLRAPVADFVGRKQEIDLLLPALRAQGRACISSISGMGGIGKTELALVIADCLQADYPDAQLFVEMRGTDAIPRTSAHALAECIRAFTGLEERLSEDVNELTKLYLSYLSGKRVLIVLDNAVDNTQVRPFLPPPGCALLITSRNALTLPGMMRAVLDQLQPEEAQELLISIARHIPRHTSNNICSLCGYLPLAIRASGSLLAITPDLDPAEYSTQLRDERTRLERIGAEGVELGVEASFNLSYAHLDSHSARVFRQLAIFAGSFDAWAEEVVCKDADHIYLSDLVRRSLVFFDSAARRYRLHDLMRLFGGRRLDPEENSEAGHRHAEYYFTILRTANSRYKHGRGVLRRGLAQFDSEWGNIQVGQSWAEKYASMDVEAASLCCYYPSTGAHLLGLRQSPLERVRWLEAALAAALQLKDRGAEVNHLINLGAIYGEVGNTDRSIDFSEQALGIAREIGSRRAEGSALSNLAGLYLYLGKPNRAIELYEQWLSIAREISYRRGEGSALVGLGKSYVALGKPHRAIQFYQLRLTIAREIKDGRGEESTLNSLGLAHADFDPHCAVEFFEQALTLARKEGNRRGEGVALGNIGSTYADLGDPPRALQFYEQRLVIAREIGDRRSESNVLIDIGNVYRNLGLIRKSIGYFEQALSITRELGNRRGEGSALSNLGVAYAELGDALSAIRFCKQSLTIAREVSSRRGEGRALGSIGDAYAELKQPREAIKYYEQSLAIAREIGNRRGEGATLNHIGRAFSDSGETYRALEYYEQSLAIAREIGNRRGEGNALGNIGLTYAAIGKPHLGIELNQKRLAIARQIGNRRSEGSALGNIGLIYATLGENNRAIEFYQQRLTIAREIDNRRGEAKTLFNISLALYQLGSCREAIAYAESALKSFELLENHSADEVRRQLAQWREQDKPKHP